MEPDEKRLGEDLRAEYLLLQAQYEQFDQRALSVKALVTPLLAGAFGAGLVQGTPAFLVTTVVAALILWSLEVHWKVFQYCHIPRIRRLESWFRGEGPRDVPPFQTFTSWKEAWSGSWRGRGTRWWQVAGQPFVCLPYAPLASAAMAMLVWQMSSLALIGTALVVICCAALVTYWLDKAGLGPGTGSS